jgi:hypothetical protein
MNQPDERPLYVSRPTVKSIWQEYRLYADRLELDVHLWGPVVVPLADIKDVSERPAGVVFDLVRGDYGLKELLRTVKLDLADLNRHVTIEKETGTWRQFRLTPEDPEEFVRRVKAARAAYQHRH